MYRTPVFACLAATFMFGGCSKDKAKDPKNDDSKIMAEAKETNKPPTSLPISAELPGPKLADVDALWAWAPKNAVLGFVLAPNAGKSLHEAGLSALKTIEAGPGGAKHINKLRERARTQEIDVLDPAAIRNAGFDLNKGAAIFLIEEDTFLGIFPISDREAFRKLAEGKAEGDFDIIDVDLICTEKESLYVCATDKALLKAAKPSKDGRLQGHLAKVDSSERGHIEMVMDVPGFEKVDEPFLDAEFDQQFTRPNILFAAARYGAGAARVGFWMDSKLKGPMVGADKVANSLTQAASKQAPSGFVGMRFPFGRVAAAEMPTDRPLPGGGSVKKDILENLTGEMILYTPAAKSTIAVIGLGIKDPQPFAKLLAMGCGMAPAAGIPGLTAKPSDKVCELSLDVSKLPIPDPAIAKLFDGPLPIRAEVLDTELRVSIGKLSKIETDASVSSLGHSILGSKWNLSLWGQGTSIVGKDLNVSTVMNYLKQNASTEELENVKLGFWTLGHLYEAGLAVAFREDGLHGIAQIGTYAADPDQAYAAYQAALRKAIESGDLSDFDAIAEKFPGTRAGSAKQAGGGSVLLGAAVGAGFWAMLGTAEVEVEAAGPQQTVP